MLGIQVTDTWAHTKASRTRDTDDGVYGTPVRSVNRSPCAREHPRATRQASPATLRRRVASSASVALVMPPTARDPHHGANDEVAGPGSPIARAAGQMTTEPSPIDRSFANSPVGRVKRNGTRLHSGIPGR